MVNWSLFKRTFVFYANKAPCSLFLHATQCFTNWEILLPHVSHSGPSFTENNGTASSRRRSSTASSTTPWWRPSRPGRPTSPSPASPSTSTASSALTWRTRGRIRAKFSRNNTRWVIVGAQIYDGMRLGFTALVAYQFFLRGEKNDAAVEFGN